MIPSIPIYIKVPINKMIAPVVINFSFIRGQNEILNPATVDVVAYLSTYEKEPDKFYMKPKNKLKNVMVKN